ncbi:hypothetical protein [Collimonas pratensis]|uniref:hypothetical protein n=1 Tax=Collimonas pratensis TaxID=279113 RepID=UPI0007858733
MAPSPSATPAVAAAATDDCPPNARLSVASACAPLVALPPMAMAPAAPAVVDVATVGAVALPPEPMETVLSAVAWVSKPSATLLWPAAFACTPTAVPRLPAWLMKPKALP